MASSLDIVRAPKNDLICPVNDADWWTVNHGFSPILGTAIHNGHNVRGDVEALMAVPGDERFREEDPFTEFVIRDLRPAAPSPWSSRNSFDEFDSPDREALVAMRSMIRMGAVRTRSYKIYIPAAIQWDAALWSSWGPRVI